ncbi:MAG: type II toxin-antitoxin system RelE/ParE family toxin [Hyphomicrobiales bacterium]
MIRSTKGKLVRSLAAGKPGKGFPSDVVRRAQLLLIVLDAANTLGDLRSPPGNRLEKLTGNLAGYHSVRINRQWRIVFKWRQGGADDVEITDYH